jgi:putative nucleotidyltransferase with HDIG domain
MDNDAPPKLTAEPRKKIFVLEDSKAQATKLAETLTKEGYGATVARDGVEGLYMLQFSTPDLIISDVWMPELDGYEFCRIIKEDKKFAHIPLILLTSLSEPKDVARGLKAGADYYLTKPYDESLLLSMVSSIVSADGHRSEGVIETLDITSRGRTERISARSQQLGNFLFSTYENLLYHNHELTRTKGELKSINDRLEEMIREKTVRLEQEITERKKANEALKRTFKETVDALARTVEMRDPYTAGHQMRVGELACAIARKLGFPEDEAEGIRVMGLLHDIGKIIVPAEILAKPSRLNECESLLIKAHPQAGYDILKEIEFPWPVATAILQHHERLNGSGYPFGLHDGEIIVEAKILAAADVMESMSSHRPYRPALGLKAALEEVNGNKGVLYSGDVAEALLKVAGEEGWMSW